MLFRRLTKIVFAPLLVLTAGALILGGCHRGGCGGGHCRWHSHSPEEKAEKITRRIAKELDLNETQKAGLDRIKGDFLARKEDFKALRGGFHEEILAQLRAGAVDKAKLNQDLAAREARFQDLRAFVVDEFAEFHALLEPAQREKLAARLEKHCRK